jgi:Ras-related protein Rab-7A
MVSSPDTFPFMVIGNKVDLEEEGRAVSSETAKEWCLQNGNLSFIETSASKNQNVEEAFVKLAT